MSEVWKFTLEITDEQEVVMPEGAELLHVADQYGKLALWARVIPTGQRDVARSFLIRGTGHPIWTQPYVGTVVTAGGSLVWHVFDGGERPTSARATAKRSSPEKSPEGGSGL